MFLSNDTTFHERQSERRSRRSDSKRRGLRRFALAGALVATAGASLVGTPVAHAAEPATSQAHSVVASRIDGALQATGDVPVETIFSGRPNAVSVDVAVEAVADPPVAITKQPSSITVKTGTPVTFDASPSTGANLTYKWYAEFKPEVYSTKPVMSYTFTEPVLMTNVKLVVEDSSGRTDTLWIDVRVEAADDLPVAQFTPNDVKDIKAGTPLTFDGSSSTGVGLTYEWSVDGEPEVVSTKPVLNYTFKEFGLFGVNLKVTDRFGRSNTMYGSAFVDPAEDPPSVRITSSQTDCCVKPGDQITLDGSASTGVELTYAWKDSGQSKVLSTKPVFQYTVPDPYTRFVELTVTDKFGRSAKDFVSIETDPRLQPPLVAISQSPASSTVASGTSVTFDGSASTGDGQLTYAWYVRGEKGVVGTSPTLQHTFKTAGTYGVELRVTDSSGRTGKKWIGLKVTGSVSQPVATFSQSPAASTVAAGSRVTFDGSASTGDELKYAWYVRGEKGVVGTSATLQHTFKTAGTYGVELRVTDSSGRVAKKWIGLKVTGTNKPPVAAMSQTPAKSSVQAGTAVTFDGSASSDPDGDKLKYYWYVRGEKGVVGTSAKLTYKFRKAGTYGVELRVVDPSGAVSKKWVGVTVTN